MKKSFMGVQLRKLRTERKMTQIAMAHALGLSPSYLNQLEQNQRPLTVAVLLKLHRALGIDIQQFSEDEESRMVAGLREALADAPEAVSLPELQEVAAQMPALGRAILGLYRRNLDVNQRLEVLSTSVGDGRVDKGLGEAMPFEAVRDFFFAHKNYFDSLDSAAEALANEAQAQGMALRSWLKHRLHQRHGVHLVVSDKSDADKRLFDPQQKQLHLSRVLEPGQQAFQMATQLALLEFSDAINALTASSPLLNAASRRLARIGLANYFAGALLLPYENFRNAAEALRYDIDVLALRFDVGFETICHRLSTLQRPSAPGVPFFFVRVDRAGNISKRQSATHFHFSRTGGTCPLWNVYEAFAAPGRLHTQVAQMPDGRSYLWVARTVSSRPQGYGVPHKEFSIGLGCDVRHAQRLVYSRGLALDDPEASTPIGMGCKVCERDACPQRAFPFVGRALQVNDFSSTNTPYGQAER